MGQKTESGESPPLSVQVSSITGLRPHSPELALRMEQLGRPLPVTPKPMTAEDLDKFATRFVELGI